MEIAVDITARKQAEESLQQTSNTLNNILASSSAYAIAAIDRDFRVVHFNPTAERLLGFTAESVIGETLGEIHKRAGVSPARLERAVQCALREGKWEATFPLHRPDGATPFVHAVVMPMREHGTPTGGFVLFARDVTAEQQAAELAQTQRDLALALTVGKDPTEVLRLCLDCALRLTVLTRWGLSAEQHHREPGVGLSGQYPAGGADACGAL